MLFTHGSYSSEMSLLNYFSKVQGAAVSSDLETESEPCSTSETPSCGDTSESQSHDATWHAHGAVSSASSSLPDVSDSSVH